MTPTKEWALLPFASLACSSSPPSPFLWRSGGNLKPEQTMKKPNITPGPWQVRQGDLVYSDHKGRFICDCERTPYEKRPAPPDEQDRINARLIAAAPQLAEALERLFRVASVELAESRPDVLEQAKTALIAAGYTE